MRMTDRWIDYLKKQVETYRALLEGAEDDLNEMTKDNVRLERMVRQLQEKLDDEET